MPRSLRFDTARLGVFVVLLVPAGLLLGLAIASGGFFPNAVSIAVVAVILVFVVNAVSSPSALSGLSIGCCVVAAGLIAFAVWTLMSGSWSGSPARATFEYDRVLLYTSVFVLAGTIGRSHARARVVLYGMAVVSAAVSIAAAATWLLPAVFPVLSDVGRQRLSWPTSYWNATGLIAALALVWATSISCSSSQPSRVRVLAAMAAPVPAATLIFTVSRGALAVAALGLIVAIVVIRSSATPGGVIAAIPSIGSSVGVALAVHGLSVNRPSAHALAQGHRTAVLLAATTLGAGALRAALVPLDTRLIGARAPWTRAQFRVALGVAAAIAVAGFVVLGGPHAVRAGVHQFVSPGTESVGGGVPAAQRLTRLGGNGRIDEWRVAIDHGFLPHPIIGTGAGTYATLWTRYGTNARRVLDAHSLYLQELAELGIIGGGGLIVIVASILVTVARRARGAEREVWAALLATAVMWAVHAGVDWDWEMPAATAWFFAVGGLALAAPRHRHRRETHPRVRLAVGLGCLLLTVTPVVVWRSQTQLMTAVADFERGDCIDAERAALASNAALSSRPDPFELIGYCEVGVRQFSLALNAIRAAETRDPQNWELRYSDSLISAAAGLDPRAPARAAVARYPTSPLTRAAARAFSVGTPSTWRRFAVSAPLPLPWAQDLAVPVQSGGSGTGRASGGHRRKSPGRSNGNGHPKRNSRYGTP